MNKTVHSCAIILYTCQKTLKKSLLLTLLLVSNKTHTHTCMHDARAHTHTPHVLVNTHALNVTCIRHFQELSINQDVNVQEFIWILQKIFLSVNVFSIFVCVSKA